MDKLNFIFTGTLAFLALSIQKLGLIITFFSNEQLQRGIFWLTILWFFAQFIRDFDKIITSVKKRLHNIKTFFRRK